MSKRYFELNPISKISQLQSISKSSDAFPRSWLFTFKDNKLLLNESFTALDFSIETVETLSIAFENSWFETTSLFRFSFGIL